METGKSVLYQIYPLGFCGAERTAVTEQRHRLGLLERAIPHIVSTGATGVLLNPVFESETHGYDTVDPFRIDKRLGTNEEFAALVEKMHENGLAVILDGVFHHVGRAFPFFRDVLEKRENSAYKDWFRLDFGGNTPYNDGLWYEPWEGHYELAALNVKNREVEAYLLDALKFWQRTLGADGLRLDVGYSLPPRFLRTLKKEAGVDFYLVGEMIRGDYGVFLKDTGLDAVTDYECYKGIYSSLNSRNMFEIEYSLNRLFGTDPWAVCRGRDLLNFVDNHDVTRLYTQLTDKRDVYAAYVLLFTMPGTPCVYYGSEFMAEGSKTEGDWALRPAWEDVPKRDGALAAFIAKLARIKRAEKSLWGHDYQKIYLTNTALAFGRGDLLVVVNLSEEPIRLPIEGVSLLTGEPFTGAAGGKCADVIRMQ